MWLSAKTNIQEIAHHLPHPHYQHPHHYRPHGSHTQRSVCVQQRRVTTSAFGVDVVGCRRSASVGRFADFTFQFRAKRGSGWSAPSTKRQTAKLKETVKILKIKSKIQTRKIAKNKNSPDKATATANV